MLWKSETGIFCSAGTFLGVFQVLLRNLFLATVHRDLSTIMGLFFDIIDWKRLLNGCEIGELVFEVCLIPSFTNL